MANKKSIISRLQVFMKVAKEHRVHEISDINNNGYENDYNFSFLDKSGEPYEVFHDHTDDKIKILFDSGAESELPNVERFKEILDYNEF